MDINIAHGLSALWNCLIIALAASSISMSITQAELFSPCVTGLKIKTVRSTICLNVFIVSATR
ncbi:hypothetical protein EC840_101600 [Rahnella sp. JUb53]|nr:hypothetical protein EC840_101600 [Rahnella sp. JUb53]